MLKPYFETELGKLYHGDCLEIMPHLEPVDLVLTDPPYGVTAAEWDNRININNIIQDNDLVIVTAIPPFSSVLIYENLSKYKYSWIWAKNRATGFPLSKFRPLRNYEEILVFSYNTPPYSPQKTKGHVPTNSAKGCSQGTIYHGENIRNYNGGSTERYPLQIQFFKCERGYHETQKPVALMKYMIQTYNAKSICDPFLGSGTTAVACERLNRRWIGIEIEEKYCEIAAKRIYNDTRQLRLFN